MNQNTLLPYVSFSLLIILIASILFKKKKNLPPSPFPKLPIIGHLYLLKPQLYRTLDTLSRTLGPIFSLQLGSRFVVVVSSPSAVEECFTTNDVVLANRPDFLMGKYIGFNFTTMGASSYGDHWRNQRRLCSLDIFSTSRLDSFLWIRHDEVNLLLKRLFRSAQNGKRKVMLKSNFQELSFNMLMRMMTGKRYYGDDVENKEEANQVRGIIEDAFTITGLSSLSDYLPFLRWIDYKNYEKRYAEVSEKLNNILQKIVEEHRVDGSRNSMVDHLLSLQKSEPDYYSDFIIKGLMGGLLVAGSDTSGVTMEWAMALLLNHPGVLKKARDEIDTIVGHDRLVKESDLSKLHYLQNIIWETFRLFPAAPLLVPHQASADCKIGGYDIPKGTIVMVNAWSIQRDPKVWDDPTSFKPERFEGIEIETHKLMPFGMGRRSCPGYGLAQRILGLVLASLIQCFEWERVGEEKVDLSEGNGLTMPKAEPLEAVCKARSVMLKFFD